jgi:hypothetical protein
MKCCKAVKNGNGEAFCCHRMKQNISTPTIYRCSNSKVKVGQCCINKHSLSCLEIDVDEDDIDQFDSDEDVSSNDDISSKFDSDEDVSSNDDISSLSLQYKYECAWKQRIKEKLPSLSMIFKDDKPILYSGCVDEDGMYYNKNNITSARGAINMAANCVDILERDTWLWYAGWFHDCPDEFPCWCC